MLRKLPPAATLPLIALSTWALVYTSAASEKFAAGIEPKFCAFTDISAVPLKYCEYIWLYLFVLLPKSYVTSKAGALSVVVNIAWATWALNVTLSNLVVMSVLFTKLNAPLPSVTII